VSLRRFVLLLLLASLSGCLTYERSTTRVTIDRKTGIARVQVTYWNLATTETGRDRQRDDMEALDSLRRSDAYFVSSFLRGPNAGIASRRRVWIDHGKIHASYTITTKDLNQLAEGWSAGSSRYRYAPMLEVTQTNGSRTDDEKPVIEWPRTSSILVISERDPHFGEAVPFLPEIRESLAVRLPHPPPAKRHVPTTRRTHRKAHTTKRAAH